MILPQVPPMLQKRIVTIMIKECNLGFSAEEAKEFENMYDSHKEFVVTSIIKKILDHAMAKLQTGRIDEAVQIIGDLHASLETNIRCLSLEKNSNKIREYLEKLEKK